MRAIVTGGAGFIGSHLTELLLSKGIEVTVLDNLCSGTLANLKAVEKHPNYTFIQSDIRNCEEIKPIFRQVDWVFHLAGLVSAPLSIQEPHHYFKTNLEGTLNVLEAARSAGVNRFLYAASCSCYGTPIKIPIEENDPISLQTPYAMTKYFAEQFVLKWAELYSLPVLSLRLFNVFGPRSSLIGGYGGVIGLLLDEKLHHVPLTIVGDGHQTRDFVYVKDVAKAFLIAAESTLSKNYFNVGSGKEHSIEQIVTLLDSPPVVYLGKNSWDAERFCADIHKIKEILGWQPKTSFEEGLRELLLLR